MSPKPQPAMTDAEVIAAIRAHHTKGSGVEGEDREADWGRAWLDKGGTIFGPGPYAKVPVLLLVDGRDADEIVVRVHAPERLRKKLASRWRPSGPPGDNNG